MINRPQSNGEVSMISIDHWNETLLPKVPLPPMQEIVVESIHGIFRTYRVTPITNTPISSEK